MPVIFLITLPFLQEITFCELLVIGFTVGAVTDVAAPGAALSIFIGVCCIFTRNVGLEKVKPLALKCIQPSFSATDVVDDCSTPSADTTLIVAWIGALLNP